MRVANIHRIRVSAIASLACVAFGAPAVFAVDQAACKKATPPQQGAVEFSPYVGRDYPTRVLWGDTHLHTAISVDAGTICRLGQEEAFRFARGEEVTATTGTRARLGRPLDWVVITHHAEMCGLMPQLLKGDPEILATEKGKRWYDMLKTGDEKSALAAAMEIVH